MTKEEIHVAIVTLELKLAELDKQVQARGRILYALAFSVIGPFIGLLTRAVWAL